MLDILNQIGRASRLFAKETGLPDMLVGLVMVSAELLLLFSALVFVPRWMYWLCRKALLVAVGEKRTKEVGDTMLVLLVLGFIAFVLWGWFEQISTGYDIVCRLSPEDCERQ